MQSLQGDVASLAEAAPEARGAIYTRREIVEFILDLVGYASDRPLHQMRLLEPSFGAGDFLLVAAERLLEAWRNATAARRTDTGAELARAICAVELHPDSFAITRGKLVALLEAGGIPARTAVQIADAWLIRGDYLLSVLPGSFDFVVGNPPYVRQELIPSKLMAEYRARYATIYDRADLYVPFFEHSLGALAPSGKLGFICANRWMKNRYGGPLRKLVAEKYCLQTYVDMVGSEAFHSDVQAYPAITVIANDKPSRTRVASRPAITKDRLGQLAKQLLAREAPSSDPSIREIAKVADGSKPWILESLDQLELVKRLERDFPAIEDVGCKIGIGVATGADRIFIGSYEELDVEPERKLPLAKTADIISGTVKWRGLGVVNPFADSKLVDLAKFPRLKSYLERHKQRLARRHVATKNPSSWYRTVDRIHPALATKPKLLIPDIKGSAHIVHEKGRLYPHHNLYYIVSGKWPLRTLQAVLLTGIARLFVAAYATRMRGGFLRFQAQYLRRIRLPHWHDVDAKLGQDLSSYASKGDAHALDELVAKLYGLSAGERKILADCRKE